MKNRRLVSLHLPFGIYVHFDGMRRIGVSRLGYAKGLLHYNHTGKLVAKTFRSFIGEPNHYNIQKHCIGYSRSVGMLKIVHYSRTGECVGYTYRLLGVLLIH